ncbi:hypothetical protein GPECTOR_39g409 [Gonium pectorale]|uniref:Uncharacterized protein n=1 Tax=Gonium pectorale TaxID=33097 RepID=A0A150GBG6_GONPE|nr:hypothetical protein GPECTOR_39g409 [Gonium pectorale]|eukprot:KXZ46915.1 hypothetical protein GPECTOR_39g409 [Gonium pectorale]
MQEEDVQSLREALDRKLYAARERREERRPPPLAGRVGFRSDHELVIDRLAASQERSITGAAEQRSRLQERLQMAAREREAALARRAERAGSKVTRVRVRVAQVHESRQQEIESRRQPSSAFAGGADVAQASAAAITAVRAAVSTATPTAALLAQPAKPPASTATAKAAVVFAEAAIGVKAEGELYALVQDLMHRLEHRLEARNSASSSRGLGGGHGNGHGGAKAAPDNAARLLRRLFPRAPRDAPLERYPPRVLLCAFMVVRHPEVVFSGAGPREAALADAARGLVARFEALLERIMVAQPDAAAATTDDGDATPSGGAVINTGDGPAAPGGWDYLCASPVGRGVEELMARRRREAAVVAANVSGGGAGTTVAVAGSVPPSPSSARSSPYMTIGSLLVAFDDAWLRYLDQFVAWKGADAAALESELIRCAAALETSMLRKCRGDPTSERAVLQQTAHDQALLRERVAKLGGEAGLERLQAALESAHRAVAVEAAERGWGSASTSAVVSEAESTDVESPARSPGALAAASLPPAAPLDAALVSNAALVHEVLLGASSGGYRGSLEPGADCSGKGELKERM